MVAEATIACTSSCTKGSGRSAKGRLRTLRYNPKADFQANGLQRTF